ncbi:Shugoshin, C-terminal [Dillenia turbinata]|uniref:Shugoshin, C-terminal n=1 Tax=Dillenia turbinata TaxID=194707 RepID=A0AAN8VFL3_9MAGN
MKSDKMAKRSSIGNILRRRLSDITNTQSQNHLLKAKKDEKPTSMFSSSGDYIEELLKENMMLMKLVEDRNKIIELSGVELQKLRISFQSMQLQNWSLAQSNSQMIAELNLGKERVKALEHEIQCKEALLKAKNLELKVKANLKSEKGGSQEGEATDMEIANELLGTAIDDLKACNPIRRRPTRSRSMGHTASKQVAGKEQTENKRRCLRRQSAKFISQIKPSEDLFELEVAELQMRPSLNSPMKEDGQVRSRSSTQYESQEKCSTSYELQEPRKTSIGRPLRGAVEKVHSYKEAPLNTKMRRKE